MHQDILTKVHQVHFVGIGGSGMSPLAEILHQLGYAITGSDVNESDNVARMRSLGITVAMPQAVENIGDAELVVYTAAVSPDNPELVEAERRGIPLLERAKLLGLITRRYPRTVAVAGTHGKTTTTSMISQILLEADLDPSVFIGGRLPLIGANGRAGQSDTMVCEACEFKDHYLEMRPAISIVLNIDADHLDYFGTLDNVIVSFENFAKLTSDLLILNAADANTAKLIDRCAGQNIVTYGTDPSCDWSARNIRTARGAYGEYDLYRGNEFVCAVSLGAPGAHNVLNSVAAAIAADACGATPEQIAHGLAAFSGAGRRFEFLGEACGVTFADDYAHHPTEISATLDAAKKLHYNRVIAVFQPFTFSRTARHLDEFAASLSAADIAIVSDIMGSREQNTYGVSSQQITDQIENGVYLPTFEDITAYVTKEARAGDLILTMGGGDVYKCARMMKAAIEKRGE